MIGDRISISFLLTTLDVRAKSLDALRMVAETAELISLLFDDDDSEEVEEEISDVADDELFSRSSTESSCGPCRSTCFCSGGARTKIQTALINLNCVGDGGELFAPAPFAAVAFPLLLALTSLVLADKLDDKDGVHHVDSARTGRPILLCCCDVLLALPAKVGAGGLGVLAFGTVSAVEDECFGLSSPSLGDKKSFGSATSWMKELSSERSMACAWNGSDTVSRTSRAEPV